MFNKFSNKITLVDVAALTLVIAAITFFIFRMGSVLAYEWNWGAIPQYFFYVDPDTGIWVPNILARGFFTTIKLSLWATVLAFVLGTITGIMGARGDGFQRFVSRAYVEVVRNIPSLVLLIIFYYFVSSQFLDVLGLDLWLRKQPEGMQRALSIVLADAGRLNAFLSAVAALGLYEGAYICEIVRGGILGLPKGQWEGAYSIGLSSTQTFRLIILPQAIRKVAFPLAGQFISAIKDSAIVSVISIQELTFQGMEVMAATFLTFEVWVTVTLLYFTLTFSLSMGINYLEKKSFPRA
ncbi:MAG: amino acid ABC transporter permease [Desulfobacterales bacterium]|nr:MAG: amino acid ABC transporter permease [Desulfobacterales bacterium]